MRQISAWSACATRIALLVACAMTVNAAGADGGPEQPVERFQEALIAAMKDGGTGGFDARRERLQRMVDEVFDLEAVTRAVIGRHYDGLSPPQRAALGDGVRRFAVTTLAARFNAYDGERFDRPTLGAMEADLARVKGRFVSSPTSSTELDYALARSAEGWRIFNVWFDGVSGTDIQRAEFEVFLRDGGADRLRQKLDELIARLEAEAR